MDPASRAFDVVVLQGFVEPTIAFLLCKRYRDDKDFLSALVPLEKLYKPQRKTAIECASWRGDIERLQKLISCNGSSQPVMGKSLLFAFERGHTAVCWELLDAGADPFVVVNSALIITVREEARACAMQMITHPRVANNNRLLLALGFLIADSTLVDQYLSEETFEENFTDPRELGDFICNYFGPTYDDKKDLTCQLRRTAVMRVLFHRCPAAELQRFMECEAIYGVATPWAEELCAHPDATPEQALTLAAATGLTDRVDLLLQGGASVAWNAEFRYSPLEWASMNDHKEVARLLIAHKDTHAYKALLTCAQLGLIEEAKSVLSRGFPAQPERSENDICGRPLVGACMAGNKAAAEALLACDDAFEDKLTFENSLWACCNEYYPRGQKGYGRKTEDTRVIAELLLQRWGKTHGGSWKFYVKEAAFAWWPEGVQLLAAHGATARDATGALSELCDGLCKRRRIGQSSVHHKLADTIVALVEAGADSTSRQAALPIALRIFNPQLAALLIDRGARLSEVPQLDDIADFVLRACWFGCDGAEEVVELLRS